ncbi:MAG: hypothetical protein KDB01_22835 [Planctomycetaceae bacterium]|nr:hypothetical protein [Planctomycetaceae bacterium]
MNPYDASEVLPPKPDEPVDPGSSLFVRPLPRWFVLGFFGTIFLVVILFIVERKLTDRVSEENPRPFYQESSN